MSDISRAGGPSPIRDTFAQAPQEQVATVQVGESKLSDVAKRLGVDHQELQKANPQISDAVLKAGQEIRLPQNQQAQGPEQDESDEDETVDHPAMPLSDPISKNFIQAKLEGAGSHQTTDLSGSDLAHLRGGADNEVKGHYSQWKEQVAGKISPGERENEKHIPGEQIFKKYNPGDSEYKKYNPYDKDVPQLQTDKTTAYTKDHLTHVAGQDISINKPVDKSTPLVSDQPSENVSLNFGKIKYEYKPIKAPSNPSENPNPAVLEAIKDKPAAPKGFDIQTLKPW